MKNLRLLLTTFLCIIPHFESYGEIRDLEGMAALVEARTDYERMLIEARLAVSQIRLNEAKAAYEYAKVAHIKQYMAAMRRELERIYGAEREMERKTSLIKKKAKLCAGLAEGDTSKGAFLGVRYFLRNFLSIAEAKKVMFQEVNLLPAYNFVPNDDFDESIDFPGGNVGELLRFTEANDFSFTPWKEAHGHILNLLEVIVATGKKKAKEYQEYMDGIREGTLDVFKLPYE